MRGARKKLVYGVGVSDDGEFARTYVNEFGKQRSTKEYRLWGSMLERCYSEKWKLKKPTYKGCCVSEYFKSFQQFSIWCQDQVGFKSESYQLDKDLLLKGNKFYSEEICIFVPSVLNTFLISCKATRGEFPVGVSKDGGMYKSRINNNMDNRYLGLYKTPEEAFQAYKTAKENMAKELAIQYEGLVDPRAIVALNNYVVNIDD